MNSLWLGNMSMHLCTAKSPRPLFREPSGFTLIELLTVIGIIAILLGIMLPAANKARTLAKRTVCRANLHNVALAFRMYLDQYNDTMPAACLLPSAHLNALPAIASFLIPLLQNHEVLKCPGDIDAVYFRSEGSSYEYNDSLGGQKVSNNFMIKRFGATNIHVMRDYDSFHGAKGKVGSVNYLYADGRVGDRRSEGQK